MNGQVVRSKSTSAVFLCMLAAIITAGVTIAIALGGPLPESPVLGRLEESMGSIDYSVALKQGDELAVSLQTSGEATLTARLTDPDATELARGTEFRSRTTTSGTHTLSIAKVTESDPTTASYVLDWARIKATDATLVVSPTDVGWGKSSTISLAVADSDSEAVTGTVLLQRSYDGKAWTTEKSIALSNDGTATTGFTPTRRTYLRIRFDGSSKLTSTTSTPVIVNRKAYLTTPSGPSRAVRNSAFRVAGYLKPRHTAGTRPVRIECFRLQEGEYVLRKTVSAGVGNYTSSTSRYSAGITLPYAGKWRIRAVVTGDSLHATTESGYRYVTVNPTTLSISASRSQVTYSTSSKLTGVLRDLGGRPVAGKTVSLQMAADGKSWSDVKTLKTSTTGAVSTYVRPTEPMYYRFRFPGDSSQYASSSSAKRITAREVVITGTGSGYRDVYLEKGTALFTWAHDASTMSITVTDFGRRPPYIALSALTLNETSDDVWYDTAYLPTSTTWRIRVTTDGPWAVVVY